MSLVKAKVAVLGATGYIGRSLLATGLNRELNLTGFSRNPKTAMEILANYDIQTENIDSYDNFPNQEFDVIVNATGIGSPREIYKNPEQVKAVAEIMDDILFAYLDKVQHVRIFSISSGVVRKFSNSGLVSASLSPSDQYAWAKSESETRHRSWSRQAIIDLRVFAFVSRWLDPEEKFFIAEVAKCLKENLTLKTMPTDMVRDFSTADDLWEVIDFLSSQKPLNTAFDVKSLAPVSKFELLHRLAEEFGLKYEVEKGMSDKSPTGSKDIYVPSSDDLEELGFLSENTSLDNILKELSVFKMTNS